MRTPRQLQAVPECRDLRHAWENHYGERQGHVFLRVLRCPRCKTERHEILNSRGYVLKTRYRYEASYKLDTPLTAAEKAAIRLFIFTEGPK